MLFITAHDVFSQVVIKSTYKPISYDEMAKPVNEANAAFKKASDECFEYYEQAIGAYNKQNYTLANAYIKRAINLNKRYTGNLIDENNLKTLDNKIQIALKPKETETTQFRQGAISFKPFVGKKSKNLNDYIGQTLRLDVDFPVILWKKPLVNADEICKLPKDSKVFILDLTQDNTFVKVMVNSDIGYISATWILNYPVWVKH